MATLLDNYDPNQPAATTVSRTDAELAVLDARRAELLDMKAQEDAAKAAASLAVRKLAIAMHNALCPSNHAALACTWQTDPQCDAPEAANWVEPAHARWLGIVQMGVALQAQQGWTVAEPTTP